MSDDRGWEFDEYGAGATYAKGSLNVDLTVLEGDDDRILIKIESGTGYSYQSVDTFIPFSVLEHIIAMARDIKQRQKTSGT